MQHRQRDCCQLAGLRKDSPREVALPTAEEVVEEDWMALEVQNSVVDRRVMSTSTSLQRPVVEAEEELQREEEHTGKIPRRRRFRCADNSGLEGQEANLAGRPTNHRTGLATT